MRVEIGIISFVVVILVSAFLFLEKPQQTYERMIKWEGQQALGVRYSAPTLYEEGDERNAGYYAYEQRIFWNDWGFRLEFRNDGLYDLVVLRTYNCFPQVAPAWNPISPVPLRGLSESETDALLVRIRALPNPRVTDDKPYSDGC